MCTAIRTKSISIFHSFFSSLAPTISTPNGVLWCVSPESRAALTGSRRHRLPIPTGRSQPHARVCRLLSGQAKSLRLRPPRCRKPTSSIPPQPGFRAAPGDFRGLADKTRRLAFNHRHSETTSSESLCPAFMITRHLSAGVCIAPFFFFSGFLFGWRGAQLVAERISKRALQVSLQACVPLQKSGRPRRRQKTD